VGPGQVLVRVGACNICTTDYQQWLGLRRHQLFPKAFGHENAGVIEEAGEGVRSIGAGERVAVLSFGPCLECRSCRRGLSSVFCPNALGIVNRDKKDDRGYYGFYGCGEYQVVSSRYVFRLSADLPFEHGGFVEPLATVIHGMRLLRIETGEKVLVLGAGTMGMLNAQAARYYGGEVVLSEISEKKLAAARGIGFQRCVNPKDPDFDERVRELTDGAGPDAVIVAVGVDDAYSQALRVAPLGCRFLLFAAGYPEPEWSLSPNAVHYRLWQILGTYGSSVADWQEASDLLSRGAIDVEPLVEARYPLEEVQSAFVKASEPGSYRVSVLLSQ